MSGLDELDTMEKTKPIAMSKLYNEIPKAIIEEKKVETIKEVAELEVDLVSSINFGERVKCPLCGDFMAKDDGKDKCIIVGRDAILRLAHHNCFVLKGY